MVTPVQMTTLNSRATYYALHFLDSPYRHLIIMRLPQQVVKKQQVHFRVPIPTGIPNHQPRAGKCLPCHSYILQPFHLFLAICVTLHFSLGIALSLSCWKFLSLFRSMPFSHPSADGPVAAFPRQLAVRQSFGHWTLHGEKLK